MSKGDSGKIIGDLIERYPQLACLREPLQAAFELLRTALENGSKLLVCGNGGSASDAEHIVGELMKSFAYRRPMPTQDRDRLRAVRAADADALIAALEVPLAAVSLVGQIGLITAFSNDQSYDFVFAQQVYGLGKPGDVLVALSTSGNSRNVLHACAVAKARDVRVLGITGRSGGKMRDLCDVALCAPADQTHIIQELHLPIYHCLCLALESHFFGQYGLR